MDQIILDQTLEEIESEFPSFEIVEKSNSLFMKIIYYLLLIITLGGQKAFMQSYTTTIGNTVYVSSSWERYSVFSKVSLLRHERIHMRQAKKYGMFLYSFLYLMFPLPVGLAYYRAKFEKKAYEETISFAYAEGGEAYVKRVLFREHIISQFTTGKYFWMWPFRKSVEKWFDKTVDELIDNVQL
ncbi:MAG TPA: hypothetical protein VMX17_04700 [Candidatus Glassbacteria bacterium]|nr:hypothetical protein [Candidatus Glassbacteria bacterium]